MDVHIKKLSPDAKLPQYAHPGDAGMDFFSLEDVVINPNESALVKTGISMAIPLGHVGLIWDKSGIAAKHSVTSMGGVIDAGYRGEIQILLKNLGKQDFIITKHMKIAQMLIQPVQSVPIIEVDALDTTSRNLGGFGSTGTH